MISQQNAPARAKSEGVDCRFPSDFNAHTTTASQLQPIPLPEPTKRKPTLSLRPNPDKIASALKQEVNEWDIARRVRGVRPDRRISKDEAGRLLRLALQAMEGGE